MRWGTKEWFDSQFGQVHETGVDGWSIGLRGSQAVRLQQISDLVMNHLREFLRVLDIGCGIGIFMQQILTNFEVKFLHGTDISFFAVKHANSQVREAFFLQSALPSLPYKSEHFDCVFALEVIYYLDRAGRKNAINEISRVLVSGGTLCISGVIGGDGRYFSEDELLGYIDKSFEPIDIIYHRAHFYYLFEKQLMRVIRWNQHNQKVLQGDLGNSSRPKGLIYDLFFHRGFCLALRFPLMFISTISKYLLKLKFPVILANLIGKTFFPEKTKTGIVVLCRKN